jgi:hypothetical protein
VEPNGLNGEERLVIYTETPLIKIVWYVEHATSYLKEILEAILPQRPARRAQAWCIKTKIS